MNLCKDCVHCVPCDVPRGDPMKFAKCKRTDVLSGTGVHATHCAVERMAFRGNCGPQGQFFRRVGEEERTYARSLRGFLAYWADHNGPFWVAVGFVAAIWVWILP